MGVDCFITVAYGVIIDASEIDRCVDPLNYVLITKDLLCMDQKYFVHSMAKTTMATRNRTISKKIKSCVISKETPQYYALEAYVNNHLPGHKIQLQTFVFFA